MSSLFKDTGHITIVTGPNGEHQVGTRPIDVDLTVIKGGFSPPNCPMSFFAGIGAILAQWGSFESLHNEFLFALARYNKSDLPIPRTFTRRKDRLKDEMKKAFPLCSGLRGRMSKIRGEATQTYPDRNLLAHGQFSTRIQRKPGSTGIIEENFSVTIIAKGEKDGVSIEKDFSMPDLKRLFYRIANAQWALDCLWDPSATVEGLPSFEISALRTFQHQAQTHLAHTSNTSQSPPSASAK